MTEAVQSRTSRDHAFPVVEVFGPTIQGEGPDAGLPAAFVRFGGCDYRCSWCDSMYAVDPAQVREVERLTADDIMGRLEAILPFVSVVVLSGGNPALHELQWFVTALAAEGVRVAVETQGSVWRPWLGDTDLIVISPKGPSSGMDTPAHAAQTEKFIRRAVAEAQTIGGAPEVALKFVIFDESDLDFAAFHHGAYPGVPCYLSAGTTVSDDAAIAVTRADVCGRLRWLYETAPSYLDGALSDCRVLPQLHVLAWGQARGV